ncbi:MAG TPA: hypothetical protein VNV44_15095 [Solirubrobacteraceae bacterium]|nr:hypothetical protein [Solirubrobacteraceae bacterium]
MPSPMQMRQQQKRDEKLQNIREQVADGKLVIRKMTPAERERFPPRAQKAQRSGSKRG